MYALYLSDFVEWSRGVVGYFARLDGLGLSAFLLHLLLLFLLLFLFGGFRLSFGEAL